MNLADHLRVRTPILWVVSTDHAAVADEISALVTKRSVMRFGSVRGLTRYSHEKGQWLAVMKDTPEGATMPINDPYEALLFAEQERGTLMIDHSHKLAEAIAPFLVVNEENHRGAFFGNRGDKVPVQFILVSAKDEVPVELGRLCPKLSYDLPSEEALVAMLSKLTSHKTPALVARAGLGMSAAEFRGACVASIAERGDVDVTDISDAKLDRLRADGLLEVRYPTLKLDDLGGLDLAKQLINDIAWAWNNPDQAKEYDLEPLRRVLMVGVPGTGKSALAECAASQLGLELAKGGVSNALNKYVGESESNMRKMFEQLKAMAPIVFWIDELGRDLSGGQSSGSVDGGTTDRVHGEFLTGIQELPNEIFLMAAANRIDQLSPEMLRADRFDKVLFVGFPTLEERQEIFKIHIGRRHEEYDLKLLAENTEDYTGAEIKALMREVRFKVGAGEKRFVTTADVVAAAPRLKGRVWVNHREAIVSMYETALANWDWASSGQENEARILLHRATKAPKATAITGQKDLQAAAW